MLLGETHQHIEQYNKQVTQYVNRTLCKEQQINRTSIIK